MMTRGLRRRRLLAFLSTATAFSAFVACNSISGLDQDFSLSQTTPTPGSETGPDGAPLLPEGSATGDGPTTDGPITNTPCPTPRPAGMLFCDDFEGNAATPLFGWDRRENKGGNPEVEGNVGNASSKGLRTRAATGAGCSGSNSCAVVLWKNIGNQFPKQTAIKLAFQFRVTEATIDYAIMGAIQISGPGGGFEYGIAVYKNPGCPGGNACVDENQPNGAHNFSNAIALTLNTWHQAEVTITRNNANNYEGRVILDGATSLDTRPEAFAWSAGPIEPNTVEVGAGAFFTGNNGTNVTETNIDNVVVTKTPP